MTSRVVHTRIKDETIIKLMDMLSERGVLGNNITIAGVISRCCDAMAGTSKKVYRPGFNFSEELDKRLGVENLDTIFQSDELGAALDKLADGQEPVEGESSDPIREAIRKRVAALESVEPEVAEGFIAADPTTIAHIDDLDDGGGRPSPPIQIDSSKLMELSKIQKLAPKDRLLEEAQGNEWKERALEVVYGQLAIDDWGSKTAEKLFINIYNDLLKSYPDGFQEDTGTE